MSQMQPLGLRDGGRGDSRSSFIGSLMGSQTPQEEFLCSSHRSS